MKILLVNDDGIDSKRLKFTKSMLDKFSEVTVVAPIRQQSGKSCAISIGGVEYKKIDDFNYAIRGTPADCVSFGIYGLNKKYDFVVSGVNNGYNIGVDTMYSGTVGAAYQANYHNHRAIALSGDYKGDKNIMFLLEDTLKYVIDNNLTSNNYVTNINFPSEASNNEITFKPKITTTYFIRRDAAVKLTNQFCHIERNDISVKIPNDSDFYAVNNGYVSISKLYLAGEII